MLVLTLVGLVVLALLLVVGFAFALHAMGYAAFTFSGVGSGIVNVMWLVLAAIGHTAAEVLNSK